MNFYKITGNLMLAKEDHWTYPREKLDRTSSYMKCKSMVLNEPDYSRAKSTYTYKANVCKVSETPDEVNMDCGPVYTFTEGTAKYMTNSVKEDGYRLASIHVVAPIADRLPFTMTVNTVWSPDSI